MTCTLTKIHIKLMIISIGCLKTNGNTFLSIVQINCSWSNCCDHQIWSEVITHKSTICISYPTILYLGAWIQPVGLDHFLMFRLGWDMMCFIEICFYFLMFYITVDSASSWLQVNLDEMFEAIAQIGLLSWLQFFGLVCFSSQIDGHFFRELSQLSPLFWFLVLGSWMAEKKMSL